MPGAARQLRVALWLCVFGWCAAAAGEACGDRCMCCMCNGCQVDPKATQCTAIAPPPVSAVCAADPARPECGAAHRRERYCCHAPGVAVYAANASNLFLGSCGGLPTYPAECGAPRCTPHCDGGGGAAVSPALWLLVLLLAPCVLAAWLWYRAYDLPGLREALVVQRGGVPFKLLPQPVLPADAAPPPPFPRGESQLRLFASAEPDAPLDEDGDGAPPPPPPPLPLPATPAQGSANPLNPPRGVPGEALPPPRLEAAAEVVVTMREGALRLRRAQVGEHERESASVKEALAAAQARTQALQAEWEKCPLRKKVLEERLADVAEVRKAVEAQVAHEEGVAETLRGAAAGRRVELDSVHQAAYQKAQARARKAEQALHKADLGVREVEKELPVLIDQTREAELTAARRAGQGAYITEIEKQAAGVKEAAAAMEADAAALIDAADGFTSEQGEWEAKNASLARRQAALEQEAAAMQVSAKKAADAAAVQGALVEEKSARTRLGIRYYAALCEAVGRKRHDLTAIGDRLQFAADLAGKKIEGDRLQIQKVASRASLAVKSSERVQFKIDTLQRKAALARQKAADAAAAAATQETLLNEHRLRLKHLTQKVDDTVTQAAVLRVEAGSCDVAVKELQAERHRLGQALRTATAAAKAAAASIADLEGECARMEKQLRSVEAETAEKNGTLAAKEVLIAEEKARLLEVSSELSGVISLTLEEIRRNEAELGEAITERDDAEARVAKREEKLADLDAELRSDNVRYEQELALIQDENLNRQARVAELDSQLETRRTLLSSHLPSAAAADVAESAAASPSPIRFGSPSTAVSSPLWGRVKQHVIHSPLFSPASKSPLRSASPASPPNAAAPATPSSLVSGLLGDGFPAPPPGAEAPAVAVEAGADRLRLYVGYMSDHGDGHGRAGAGHAAGLKFLEPPALLEGRVGCISAACDHFRDHGYGYPEGEMYLVLLKAAGGRVMISLFGVVGRDDAATHDLLRTFAPAAASESDEGGDPAPSPQPFVAAPRVSAPAELLAAAAPGDHVQLAYRVGPRGYRLQASNVAVSIALLDADAPPPEQTASSASVKAGWSASTAAATPPAAAAPLSPLSGRGVASPLRHARQLPPDARGAPWPSWRERTAARGAAAPPATAAPAAESLVEGINAATDPTGSDLSDLLGGISFAVDD
eukprot:TRINITY_DN6215_c2_g1_i1.p1 TRINITY_DN6215_c2_g1~~TRINITY_DN6215_c2_g1_i1.p1  ORF type:complete len:1220 (+),score=455.59 TRINITY_DN6215_c2_g1_i1:134-3661(+)